MYFENDTPGGVDIEGRTVSAEGGPEKLSIHLIFPDRGRAEVREGKRKKSEKNFKKGLAQF